MRPSILRPTVGAALVLQSGATRLVLSTELEDVRIR
jgi:hypothetical protein